MSFKKNYWFISEFIFDALQWYYCWNSMLTDAAEGFAMAPKAVLERIMVAPLAEGLDTDVSARSTILIWMVWLGLQVPGEAALMHLTKYCRPQEAPLSHIPSPAAANKLFVGNWEASFPKQAVAALKTIKNLISISSCNRYYQP